MFQQIDWVRHVIRAMKRDKANFRSLGPVAPRYAERLQVEPVGIKVELVQTIKRSLSGAVMQPDWQPETRSIMLNPKITFCLRHWRDGLDWEQAGAIEFHLERIKLLGHIDHCRTLRDVERRLLRLDQIWDRVTQEGRLRTAQDIDKFHFREFGGLLVHLGVDGELIFGGGGQHRLGIALAAGLREIPVQLGVVHPSALSVLASLRCN